MKKLQTIGKILSKAEQKSIVGGYEPGVADAQCIFDYDMMNPICPDQYIYTLYDCTDPQEVTSINEYARNACLADICCLSWVCFPC
jgi:hypothetical protein